MKPKKLGRISSFSIQGKTLFAINEEWKKFLGDTPTFEVIIDKDERYCLLGPKVNYPRSSTQTPEGAHHG